MNIDLTKEELERICKRVRHRARDELDYRIISRLEVRLENFSDTEDAASMHHR
jgi:putative IMPACT (imprinted ancient) family translation regulator